MVEGRSCRIWQPTFYVGNLEHPWMAEIMQFKPMECKKLRVDIVADGGATWIKPKSLADRIHERTSYGLKSIEEQAEEYVEAAEANPHKFKRADRGAAASCRPALRTGRRTAL